jgi:disease resistance protein RPM1
LLVLLGVLCKLPNLKSLYVTWTRYGDGERDDELVARSCHRFPVLRDVILGGCLPRVIRFEQGSMSMLETLELRFDYRSTHVTEWSIVGIEQLTSLKKVTLDGT